MPFGSILASLTDFFLEAADGQTVAVQNSYFTRPLLKLVGLPHIGLRIRANLVMSVVQKIQPQSIIDAGSGNGLYTLELGRQGYRVYALEISEKKASWVTRYITELNFDRVSVQKVDLTSRTVIIC